MEREREMGRERKIERWGEREMGKERGETMGCHWSTENTRARRERDRGRLCVCLCVSV